jgi:hypothetical protein
MFPIGYILDHKENIEMIAIAIIICGSSVLIVSIITFGTFCMDFPDDAAKIFGRKDDSGTVKIRLKGAEKKKYREFLFRHGYEGHESTFAKDALFRAMQEHDLSSLDSEKESLEMDLFAGRGSIFGIL